MSQARVDPAHKKQRAELSTCFSTACGKPCRKLLDHRNFERGADEYSSKKLRMSAISATSCEFCRKSCITMRINLESCFRSRLVENLSSPVNNVCLGRFWPTGRPDGEDK